MSHATAACHSSAPRTGRRHVADGFKQPAMIEPIHPIERGELDGLEVAHGPFRRITSVLKRPITDSCSQSCESPRLPTDGSMPASANRSV